MTVRMTVDYPKQGASSKHYIYSGENAICRALPVFSLFVAPYKKASLISQTIGIRRIEHEAMGAKCCAGEEAQEHSMVEYGQRN